MISLLALGVVPHAAHGEDDFNHHLSASVQLYKSLEYEQAMVQLQRAKQLARSTGQNASIALHEGIFLADLGKREESLAAFRAALLLEPEAKLPFKVSPKMVRDFEDARVRVRMELAAAPKPEPQGISSKEFMPLSALAGSPARSSPVDRVTLLERLSHDEALLHQRGNPPDGGPAVAQLKQMREQVEQAVNVVQRMDVFVRLEEWERQFLQKEASPASAPLARTPAGPARPEPRGSPLQPNGSDIMATVMTHKSAIVECVKKQRGQQPGLSGRLVMRWFIYPDGSAKEISCVSGALCSTYLAGCLTGLIQGWTFPTRAARPEAIDFPIVF